MPSLLRDEVRLVLRLQRPVLAMFLGICLSLMALLPVTARENGNHAAAVSSYNRGVQLFGEQRSAEAIAEFRKALALDGLANAHGPLGQLLFLNGDFAGAMPELLAATAIEPMNAAVWCQLGIAASRTQRFDVMQPAFQRYLALEPNGSYSNEARRSLAIVQPHGAAAADYVQDFHGGMRKWQRNTLNVFVPQTARDEDRVLIAAALQQWTKMAEGRIQFQVVTQESQAQIAFAWTTNRAEMESADELGTTALKMNAGGALEHARITLLATSTNAATADEQARREFAVVLHELGHALGLQHSTEPGDIMCATVAPMGLEFAPTARDKNTLLAIYSK
jgi:tetratricopeptide (TPR) repeat protein